ncbi:hypothetical protein DXG01_010875, partial [Tephrocybe rancida]
MPQRPSAHTAPTHRRSSTQGGPSAATVHGVCSGIGGECPAELRGFSRRQEWPGAVDSTRGGAPPDPHECMPQAPRRRHPTSIMTGEASRASTVLRHWVRAGRDVDHRRNTTPPRGCRDTPERHDTGLGTSTMPPPRCLAWPAPSGPHRHRHLTDLGPTAHTYHHPTSNSTRGVPRAARSPREVFGHRVETNTELWGPSRHQEGAAAIDSPRGGSHPRAYERAPQAP